MRLIVWKHYDFTYFSQLMRAVLFQHLAKQVNLQQLSDGLSRMYSGSQNFKILDRRMLTKTAFILSKIWEKL